MENLKESKLSDFDIIKKVGEGAFGKVYKVRRKSDKEMYAMKVIKLQKMDKQSI